MEVPLLIKFAIYQSEVVCLTPLAPLNQGQFWISPGDAQGSEPKISKTFLIFIF